MNKIGEKSFITCYEEDINGRIISTVIFQGTDEECVKFYMENKENFRVKHKFLTLTLK